MLTNLIIGIATGYDWQTLEPFVMSLRRTGYDGRCVLILDRRADDPLYAKLQQYNISTITLDELTEDPIVIRFMVIADLIATMADDLKHVICVDTKDVVFQYDPMEWLKNYEGSTQLVVVSEGALYANSVGNKKNAIAAFGKDAYEKLANEEVCNAGVIAGHPKVVRQLCLGIYALCHQDLRLAIFKPTYEDMLPDQTAMNILLRQDPFKKIVSIIHAKDGFSFCGVFSKIHLQQDEADLRDYVMYPKGQDKPFAIFHQYFAWQLEVRERYRESN